MKVIRYVESTLKVPVKKGEASEDISLTLKDGKLTMKKPYRYGYYSVSEHLTIPTSCVGALISELLAMQEEADSGR